MQTRTCPQNLCFLYAVDCLVKALPEAYAVMVEDRVCRLFAHVYRNADPETAFQLVVLLEVWEGLKPALFALATLEKLRESLCTLNSQQEIPDSPDIQAESGGWDSNLPVEVTQQISDDAYGRLFARLMDSNRKKEERDLVLSRAALVPATEYEEGLAVYVDEMYSNPRQCRTCGMRFADLEQIKEHETAHISPKAPSLWLPKVEDWTASAFLPAADSCEEVICMLCGHPFPRHSNPYITFPYLQAVIVYSSAQRSHTLVHVSCFQSNTLAS